MTNSLNIPATDFEAIQSLTADQLRAIRRNLQESEYSDDETREAMMQAVADGHEVEEFFA